MHKPTPSSPLTLWHHEPAIRVLETLRSDAERGLSENEADARLKADGPNQLKAKRRKTLAELFLSQFHQPLVYVLLIAATVTGFLGEWVDTWVILGVVVINAIVGTIQEARAIDAINALSSALKTEANVVREGHVHRIEAANVVRGDIVILRSGDKVPADMRLFQVKEARIDESSLTGESVPVQKNTEELPPETTLAERVNMAYAGSLVTYGQAKGIVTATGIHTEIGRVSELLDEADMLETPLTRKLTGFSKVLLFVILGLALVTFLIGMSRGEPLIDVFMAAVALAVGAIPEGLPAAVTIILAIGVSRMAKRKAIIRRLPAVETLGSVTIICTDKTGTLTVNKMTVQNVWASGMWFNASGSGYDPYHGDFTPVGDANKNSPALQGCLRAGLLCNDSQLFFDGNGAEPKMEGDPTEAALLTSAIKAGLVPETEKTAWPRKDEIPFESEYQYMATQHKRPEGDVVFVKGSVEAISKRCTHMMGADGRLLPLDTSSIQTATEAMSSKGLRVLAMAQKTGLMEMPLRHEHLHDMVFLGLQGMMDPPREEAGRAIAACYRAGIDVKMITGDHIGTAVAIGKMLGMRGSAGKGPEDFKALTGAQLETLEGEELVDAAIKTTVFARVTPEQKLRLVQALQSRGHIVAMTGDGVNDAPALRQAYIGVAMGKNGTETAKEASDMVLADDNFATIEAAVEEGRGVYNNLVKFIAWTIPTNLGEGLVILSAFFLGTALPIAPVQLLWINMTTAVCLGLMLVFEPQEKGLMNQPPRSSDIPILSPLIIQRILLVSFLLLVAGFGMFEWMLVSGAPIEAARSAAVNVFVMVELVYLFNTRSFLKSPFAIGILSNPWTLLGSAIMIGLQVLFTHAPFMNKWFGTAPIGLNEWGIIALIAIFVFSVIEAEKKVRAMFVRRKTSRRR